MVDDLQLRGAALHINIFLSADLTGSPERTFLDHMWRACGRLGMDRPAGRFDDMSFPDLPGSTTGFRPLRARANSDPSLGVHQALLYAAGGVIGLTAVLAPPFGKQPPDVWRELDARWERETQLTSDERNPPHGLIGTARLYRTLTRRVPVHPAAVHTLGRRLSHLLPENSTAGLPEALCPEPGLLMWEISPSDGSVANLDRRFLVTGADDRQLDAWVWAAGLKRPVPFTRYLMHAAELRHQCRVWLDFEEELHHQVRRLHREGKRVLTNSQAILGSAHATRRDLTVLARLGGEAEQLLLDARTRVVEKANLRIMRQTVRLTVAALEADLRASHDGPDPALFPSDQECAASLISALDNDTPYLEIAQEQATEAARIVNEAVSQRLQQHQQQLSLLQTSLLGSLLMALAAIQSLSYKLPLPGPVQGPLILFLSALALCLPSAVLRRWRGMAGGRAAGVFDAMGLIAMGASGGWLACAALRVAAAWEVASWPVAGAWATVGGLTALLLGTLLLRSDAAKTSRQSRSAGGE